MSTPLVSVLMTAYNREAYIGEAIESVLASSWTNLELIIVDDCSKDRTVEIARSYAAKDNRIRVYQNEQNLGDYPNRNRAASLAKGEYIKYVDSDDVMFTSCLSKMMAGMLQYPDAGYGLCSAIHPDSKICTSPRETYLESFGGVGHFDRSPGGAIIKKEAFDRVGGFSGIRQVGDFEFWLRIGASYPMVKVPFQIYWVRDHEGQESLTDSLKKRHQLRVQVLEKLFSEGKVPVPLEEKEKSRILRNYKRTLWTRIVNRLRKPF